VVADGKYLAFSSKRGDHGFVGIFSFAEKSLRYLDPSTAIDGTRSGLRTAAASLRAHPT